MSAHQKTVQKIIEILNGFTYRDALTALDEAKSLLIDCSIVTNKSRRYDERIFSERFTEFYHSTERHPFD